MNYFICEILDTVLSVTILTLISTIAEAFTTILQDPNRNKYNITLRS